MEASESLSQHTHEPVYISIDQTLTNSTLRSQLHAADKEVYRVVCPEEKSRKKKKREMPRVAVLRMYGRNSRSKVGPAIAGCAFMGQYISGTVLPPVAGGGGAARNRRDDHQKELCYIQYIQ